MTAALTSSTLWTIRNCSSRGFRGRRGTRGAWCLKAIFALPMSDEEKAFFRTIADRDPPTEPCTEVWLIVGRRGGKDSVASLLGAYIAAMFNNDSKLLRPGERGASCAWPVTAIRPGSF